MENRVGQNMGTYRLTRLLGRGAFAEVYLGLHRYLHIQAAIKVLYDQLRDHELEHFFREAGTIASLMHPHIVRILDFGMQDNDESVPVVAKSILDIDRNEMFMERQELYPVVKNTLA